MDWFGLLVLLGIGQSLILGIILKTRRIFRHGPEQYLGAIQAWGAMALTMSLVTTTNLYELFPWLLGVAYPFFYLLGSGSYLYISALTEKDYKPGRKNWPLLIVPMVGSLGALRLILLPMGKKIELLQYTLENHGFSTYEWILYGGALIYIWVCLVFSFRKIHLYRKKLRESFSNTQGIDLKLLTRHFFFYVSCWLIITLLSILSFNRLVVELSIKLAALFPAIYLLISGFSGLFALYKSMPQKIEKEKPQPKKEDLSEKFHWLEEEMKTRKHYLNPNLTLPDLADQISFLRNELSQVINQESGGSFYTYVNHHRIQHFINLLEEDKVKERTILDLSLESGFNSKGAFYSAFKGVTGKTPKQYLKEEISQGSRAPGK